MGTMYFVEKINVYHDVKIFMQAYYGKENMMICKRTNVREFLIPKV